MLFLGVPAGAAGTPADARVDRLGTLLPVTSAVTTIGTPASCGSGELPGRSWLTDRVKNARCHCVLHYVDILHLLDNLTEFSCHAKV